MKKNLGSAEWKNYVPVPVCEDFPEYEQFYYTAWECAYKHIRNIPDMPEPVYMDEAFCDTQIWIWDSCFMSLFCKYAQEVFPGVETLRNFYEVLYGGKSLGKIIPRENEPGWTGAVAGKPSDIKIHIADNPPLFAFAEYENALFHGDKEYIKELLYKKQFLQKHYEWIESLEKSEQPEGVFSPTCLINEKIGYRWEGGRSGMDNTPRGRTGVKAEKERPNNPDMLWLDAICQQALSAKLTAKLFEVVGDSKAQKEWEEKYRSKKETVNRYYWDAEDNFYYDIDCNTKEFYKVMTVASFWTLTAEIASEKQAKALVKYASDPNTLGGEVPLISLSRSDPDFHSDGCYWRGGLWLPTAYAALKGMAKYGFYKPAHVAAHKIFNHMLKTYNGYEPHSIWECYSPDFCTPADTVEKGEKVRKDFCGWSALGPIAVYIEYVLGFYKVDAFQNVVEWAMPDTFKKEIGIKNLHFGEVVTDILAKDEVCTVTSNLPYTLKINGRPFEIAKGENRFSVRLSLD